MIKNVFKAFTIIFLLSRLALIIGKWSVNQRYRKLLKKRIKKISKKIHFMY